MTNLFKHTICALLLPAAVILLLTVQTFAVEDTAPPASPHAVDADVTYGFSDSGKLGTYLPVTITIDSQYAGTGGIASLYYYTEESKRCCIEESFLVTEDGCRITLYLPVFTESIPVKITLQADGRIVFTDEHIITSSDSYQMTIAVVTNAPDSYTIWDHLLLNEAYHIYSDILLLSPEELPYNSLDFNMVDILILDDTYETALTANQLQTIRQWLSDSSHLRHLILSRPQSVLLSSTDQLLTASANGEFLLNNLTEQADPEYIFDELLGVNCTDYKIQDAAVLVMDNGHPLIQQVPYEAGTITVTGYGLSQVSAAFAAHTMAFRSFWNTLLDEADFSLTVKSHDFFDTYETNQASLLAGQNQLQYVSRVGLFIVILLIYVAVCIPLIFYFTKLKKKLAYLRLFLAGNALLFSLVIIIMAIPTRHDKVFLNSICLEEYTDTTLEYFSYNSIQSPYGNTFSVQLDASWQVLPDVWGQSAAPDADEGISFRTQEFTVYRSDTALNLNFTNQIPFRSNYFELIQHTQCSSSPITSDISFFDGVLTGTITNHLGYDLENAVLLIQGWIVPIHTFPQNSTIHLADYDKYLFQSNAFSKLLGTMTLEENVYQQQAIRQEQTAQLYQLMIDRLMTSAYGQGILLGSSDQTWDLCAADSQATDSNVSHFTAIRLDVNTTRDTLHYMPSLPMLPDCLEGAYDWYTRELLSSEAALSYSFYKNMDIQSLQFAYSSLPDGLDWPYQQPELTYAYNWDMGKYVPLTSDTLSQPELSSYLQDNQLLIYYTAPANAKVVLPDISVIWKDTKGE